MTAMDNPPTPGSARRSLLFVPGSRPDRFDKAAASGADIACIDLEDAVAPAGKDEAREATLAWLAARKPVRGREIALRINGLKTLAGIADIAAFAKAGAPADILVLPKVDSGDEIGWAADLLAEAGAPTALMALIESAHGLENVHAIAAGPRLELLLFGAVDLSAELGMAMEHEPLLYARSRCAHAARRAGVGLLDVPTLDFKNLGRVEDEARTAQALGFTGKAALHPSNIETVNTVFTPSPEAIARARQIIDLFERSETGLVVLDGKLIEAPVVRAMREVLAMAAMIESAGSP